MPNTEEKKYAGTFMTPDEVVFEFYEVDGKISIFQKNRDQLDHVGMAPNQMEAIRFIQEEVIPELQRKAQAEAEMEMEARADLHQKIIGLYEKALAGFGLDLDADPASREQMISTGADLIIDENLFLDYKANHLEIVAAIADFISDLTRRNPDLLKLLPEAPKE